MNNEFFLTVNMANHGLRIVRIRRLGIAVQPLPLYWLARIRNRFGDYSARAQREIGFYDSSRAILNEVLSPPDVRVYPPERIELDEAQSVEIRTQ
jgi:hypothetical protein